jgi:hypothetical protein
LIKVVSKIGARARIEVPMYEGNLEVEEFLDWVRAMEKYFYYEDIKEDKMVKHLLYKYVVIQALKKWRHYLSPK